MSEPLPELDALTEDREALPVEALARELGGSESGPEELVISPGLHEALQSITREDIEYVIGNRSFGRLAHVLLDRRAARGLPPLSAEGEESEGEGAKADDAGYSSLELPDHLFFPPGAQSVPLSELLPSTGALEGVPTPAAEASGPTGPQLGALLEVLDAYFASAPEADPQTDGLDEPARALLLAVREALRDELQGPDVLTVNAAPVGRIPWEVLGVNETTGTVEFGADLTDGKAVDPWRNAMLSADAKRTVLEAHEADPARYSIARLAREFGVSRQRVHAILYLQKRERVEEAKAVLERDGHLLADDGKTIKPEYKDDDAAIRGLVLKPVAAEKDEAVVAEDEAVDAEDAPATPEASSSSVEAPAASSSSSAAAPAGFEYESVSEAELADPEAAKAVFALRKARVLEAVRVLAEAAEAETQTEASSASSSSSSDDDDDASASEPFTEADFANEPVFGAEDENPRGDIELSAPAGGPRPRLVELSTDGYLRGAGEHRTVSLPSYPNYKEVSLEAFAARLEAVVGRPVHEIAEEDITPEIARAALGAASTADLEVRLARQEEERAAAEFARRFRFNTRQVGRSIHRGSRKGRAPKRPEAGWSLVVKPLGKDASEEGGAYVAQPSGDRRTLTKDEELYQKRLTPLPRRRVF